MKSILVLIFGFGAVYGRSLEVDSTIQNKTSDVKVENREKLWNMFKGLLPNEYYDVVLTQELYYNTDFQKDVFNLALKQVEVDLDTQLAKQSLLTDYMKCSCQNKICGLENMMGSDDIKGQLKPFFEQIVSGVDLEFALRILKLLKFNIDQIQTRHKHIAKMIDCSCSDAGKCRAKITPQAYSIISGQEDKELKKAYWQEALGESPLFPSIIPTDIFQPLQSAWSSILEGFIGNFPPAIGQFIPSWVHTKNHTETIAPGVDATYVSGTFGGPGGLIGSFGGVSTSGDNPASSMNFNPGSNAYAGSKSHFGTNVHSEESKHSGSNSISATNTHSGQNKHSGSQSHSGTNAHSGENLHSGSNSHSGTNVGPSNSNGSSSGSVHNVGSQQGPTVDIVGPSNPQTGSAGSIHVMPSK